jgi:hypothetical protein
MKHFLLFLGLCAMIVSGCGGGGGDAATGGFPASTFVGNYSGVWRNTTLLTIGSCVITITSDTATNTLTMVFDQNGFVFGLTDPDAITMTGVWTDTGVTVTGNSMVYGPGQFTIDAAGNVTGSFPNMTDPQIKSMSFTGTLSSTGANLTYTQQTQPGGTEAGVVTTTKG